MSAIITENFRKNNAQLFINEIKSSPPVSEYYLGIGKQDKWSDDEAVSSFSIPVPIGSRAYELEVLNNLSTLIALGQTTNSPIGRVIPSVSWLGGPNSLYSYKAYSSYDSSCFYPTGTSQPCYVTSQGAIFMCLKAGLGNSADQPTIPTTDKYTPFRLNDGYVWVLVQEAPPTPIIRTNTFTDVRTVALTTTELNNSTTQCGGLISGFTVVNGGSGYNPSTSVFKLIRNDGFSSGTYFNDNITLVATISNGTVTAVSLDDNVPSSWPKGAVFASVENVSGPGTGAVIIPTIAPTNGFAHIPANVMPSWFVGLAVKLDDNIGGDSFYTRYRQISIIKNPTHVPLEEGEPATLNALKYFTFADVTLPTSLSVDGSKITDVDGNVIGFADHVINTAGNKKIYFHQNSVSGYRELPSTGSIKIEGSDTTYAYTSINTGEFINDGKAEVLFTENRSFITRAPGQLEDLILIIQF